MIIAGSMTLHSMWPFGGFRLPDRKVGPTPTPPLGVIAAASSLRLVKPLLVSYFQVGGRLNKSPIWARFSFSDGNDDNDDDDGLVVRKPEMSSSSNKMSGPNIFNSERQWTNVLLALNVVIYIAQVATQGKLTFWGAKINALVEGGQLWRLVTSAFLHGNIGHLLVNCYSLNAVGPSAEKISGPRRFLAIYFASAIASTTMSYFMTKNDAVGASGAIFGLVGSTAVFIMRHRDQVGGGRGELRHIMNVIAVNMVIGLLSEGIDNWGHVGGLLGGAAASWLLGPAFDPKYPSRDGRTRFADRAPIFNLINWRRRS